MLLPADRFDTHRVGFGIGVVEGSESADAQLPFCQIIWTERFPVSRRSHGSYGQLRFDCVRDEALIGSPQMVQITEGAFSELDLIHGAAVLSRCLSYNRIIRGQLAGRQDYRGLKPPVYP